jgi:4-amino-4-deoxy-L-arabinose transferase-like glycosyltransferase
LSIRTQILDPPATVSKASASLDRWLPWLLGAGAIWVVFYQLGGAAFFEPDEGRNAEKAREILSLGDWQTPHENFHPALDKPIFFYWLIASSYQLFGVSEWAARLPSALAALGCVAGVYGFARSQWGRSQALWSALILLTSLEFFLLARLVIFDMALTLFVTLALGAFYLASHCENGKRRSLFCLVMYGSLGAGTLIKGLIGIVVPGMVIFAYLLVTRRWAVMGRIHPLAGALLYLAMVLPWYVEAGARHEGYLRYYLWEEHFSRVKRSIAPSLGIFLFGSARSGCSLGLCLGLSCSTAGAARGGMIGHGF